MIVLGVTSFAPPAIRWLHTLRQNYDGRVILYLTYDPLVNTAALCADYNCEIRPIHGRPALWDAQACERCKLCEQWDLIHEACSEFSDEWILRTDVWDVVFQSDPRQFNLQEDRIYVAYESKTNEYGHKWKCGRGWNYIKDKPPVNCGMFCAKGKMMRPYARMIADCVGNSAADQSEFWLATQYYGNAPLLSIPSFLECIFAAHTSYGCIRDGKFKNRHTLKPWCVVHANVDKRLLDDNYTLAKYITLAEKYAPRNDEWLKFYNRDWTFA